MNRSLLGFRFRNLESIAPSIELISEVDRQQLVTPVPREGESQIEGGNDAFLGSEFGARLDTKVQQAVHRDQVDNPREDALTSVMKPMSGHEMYQRFPKSMNERLNMDQKGPQNVSNQRKMAEEDEYCIHQILTMGGDWF